MKFWQNWLTRYRSGPRWKCLLFRTIWTLAAIAWGLVALGLFLIWIVA